MVLFCLPKCPLFVLAESLQAPLKGLSCLGQGWAAVFNPSSPWLPAELRGFGAVPMKLCP